MCDIVLKYRGQKRGVISCLQRPFSHRSIAKTCVKKKTEDTHTFLSKNATTTACIDFDVIIYTTALKKCNHIQIPVYKCM